MRRHTDTLQTLSSDLTAAVLAAASLELKAEKQSAHNSGVSSVAFSPDGKTIVSGSYDKTLKVWDAANPRPYNAAEWEKVEGDGEEDYDEEAEMGYPYWKNTVTGDLRQEESTAGVSPLNRSKSGMQVPQPPNSSPNPKLSAPNACYRIPGAQGGEAERARRPDHLVQLQL